MAITIGFDVIEMTSDANQCRGNIELCAMHLLRDGSYEDFSYGFSYNFLNEIT